VPRDLPVEGRDLRGVHFAMDFLTVSTQAVLRDQPDNTPISARGKDVIVLGGGDTGTDCVGTSMRQGCKSLQQIEIMAMPPMDRAADNPWPEWPKVYKMDYGQEEAAALWGEDPRRYSTTTRRFIGRNEHVTGIEIADVTMAPGPDGKIGLREVPGTNQVIAADLVLLALGFVGPEPVLPKAFDCELDPRGNVRTGPDKMTTVPGVFAAGDCVRGQSLVVWAIKEGRQAAEGVDRYLSRPY
jgi:glutamate synthase (NADPH/NADH) small chain